MPRRASLLFLASFALVTGACNAIFGIDAGTPEGSGGASSSSGHATSSAGGAASSSSGSATSSAGTGGATSSVSTGGATSSVSTGGATSSSASTGGATSSAGTGGATSSAGTGGGSCMPAGGATCNGAVLQLCDANGQAAPPVTCEAVAACDAAARKCTDFSTLGRLGLGHIRACIIEDDRSVKCWGSNQDGNSGSDLVPTDVLDQVRAPEAVSGVAQARQVSVAPDHQCVLEDDGSVTCWGDSGYGQLGLAPSDVELPASVPGLGGVVEVSTAVACTCVRLYDGTIECFGQQDDGCLGTASQVTGAQPSATPIGVTGAVAIRMGLFTPSCALLASGGVTCWSDSIVPTAVPGVTSAVEIAVGWDVVIIRDATGVSWSAPLPDNSGWTTPAPFSMTKPLTAMAAGDDFCGLRSDGFVTCGDLNGTDAPSPTAALPSQPTGTVVEIASGSGFGYFSGLHCLRLAGPVAGNVYCWGDDGLGALGIGAPEDVLAPTAVSLPHPATFLSAAQSSTAVVLSDGSCTYWGDSALAYPEADSPLALALGNDNAAIGDNDEIGRAYVIKQSGAVVVLNDGVPQPGAGVGVSMFTDFVDAHAFWHWDVGLRAGGDVIIFAGAADANIGGVLGDASGVVTGGMTPKVAGLPPVQALAAYGQQYNPYYSHLCAILKTSGDVYCWGLNGSGELGPAVPLNTVAAAPTQVSLPGNDPAVTVAVGPSATCVSTASQKVYCWGDNGEGQIGQSPPAGQFPTPTQVPGITTAKGVTMLDTHACAWLSDGTVACWGRNDFGQLGAGDFDDHAGPVPVQGVTTAAQVSAGKDHTCALLADGSVTCWGSSYSGQVGIGKMGRYGKPQAVVGL